MNLADNSDLKSDDIFVRPLNFSSSFKRRSLIFHPNKISEMSFGLYFQGDTPEPLPRIQRDE